MEKCPFFGLGAGYAAYEQPTIWEISSKGELIPVAHSGEISGKAGITILEKLWEREVENFVQRHSQQ